MKKIIRKAMSIFLAMAIMLCAMSVMASAASYKFIYEKQGEDGDYYSVWITGYSGTLPAKLTIPETIEGLPVESIEPMAFMGNTAIKEVVIPDTVCWIEDYSFAKCSNLAKVTIPGSVWTIDNGAFHECKKLTDIVYTGYNFDCYDLYIGDYNDAIFENDWTWTHYQKEIETSYREYTMNYKEECNLSPDFDMDGDYTVRWYAFDNDSLAVDCDGYAYAYAKGETYVDYEIIDGSGNVVFAGEDLITVRYSFIQWIIEFLLFGWVWGY